MSLELAHVGDLENQQDVANEEVEVMGPGHVRLPGHVQRVGLIFLVEICDDFHELFGDVGQVDFVDVLGCRGSRLLRGRVFQQESAIIRERLVFDFEI